MDDFTRDMREVSAEGIDPHFSWGVIPRKDLPIANAC
jgi:hypothetical protein